MEIKENYSTASTQELILKFVDLTDLTHNVHWLHSKLQTIFLMFYTDLSLATLTTHLSCLSLSVFTES